VPPRCGDSILGQPKKRMRIIRRQVLPLVIRQEEVRSHTMETKAYVYRNMMRRPCSNEVRVSAALSLDFALTKAKRMIV